MTETALTTQTQSPAEIMQQAIASGVKPEDLDKMLDMQMKWEQNEAKKAYVRAMAEFKKNAPEIVKDKTNKQFNSRYTSIEALVIPASLVLSEHGISNRWEFGKLENGDPEVTCILTHELGHSESVTMSCPPDQSGGNSKNAIQKIKSAHTYLKIATFEAATGLVSKDANVNDDGNGAYADTISAKQKTEMEKIIKDKGVDEAAFLGYMNVGDLDSIKLADHNKAMLALSKANGKKEAKK